MQTLNRVIWGAFVVQFIVEFAAAPSKRVYLRQRWITALSLALPALRCCGWYGSPAWHTPPERRAESDSHGC